MGYPFCWGVVQRLRNPGAGSTAGCRLPDYDKSSRHIPSAPVETADEHYGNRFVIEDHYDFYLAPFYFLFRIQPGNNYSAVGRSISAPATNSREPNTHHIIFGTGKITVHTWGCAGHRRFLYPDFTQVRRR